MKSIYYGQISSLALDPIEKKPLYHFHPGSKILSVGGVGCNMTCPFCQNHGISQPEDEIPTKIISPETLRDLACHYREQGNIGVAFTYNEPLLCYDYIRDCSILLKEEGLKTVIVSNGCFGEKVIDMVREYVDAANIDLKAFTEDGYKSLGGSLNRVKSFIEKVYSDIHLEITSLIVPGLNDDPKDMEAQAKWIASLNPEIVLHITRFFPMYKMLDREPTDIAVMENLKHIASEYLKNVYLGNV